ncbi:MAG TPA: hypothetical protein VMU20_00270 [Candidatus Dormibacteraeota bacterium]|jgi:hypothetical protein|nr:hypothetical protein [Candidatus Dormibacteraeota bacterium]
MDKNLQRLAREHSRQVIGGALIIAAAIALLAGYISIRDEIYVAVQMPYVLVGGVGALLLAGLGMVVIRSQDDKAVLDRLAEVESTNHQLRDRVDYLAQLLEAALLPDESTEVRGVASPVRAEVR